MKKMAYAALLMAAVLSMSGCSQNSGSSSQSTASQSAEESHTVVLDEVGLTYTTPAAWKEFEETNLFPLTIQSEGTLARIIYNYVKEGDIEKLYDISDPNDYETYLTPICEIMIASTENFTNGTLESLTSLYEKSQEVSTEGDYSYYVLYSCTYNNLEGADLENFSKMAEAVPELIDSISTREFNPEDVKPVVDTDELKKYVTFDTKTLEGESITSSVFGDYDLTMVNFWGTYALETSNEQAVLQQVYETIKSEGKNVNLINAIVDTPSPENEETVKQLKAEAGGQFTTIIMDETLANWAVENLEGVPTTVFVDSTGKIVGDQVKGAKSANFYMKEINSRLAAQ